MFNGFKIVLCFIFIFKSWALKSGTSQNHHPKLHSQIVPKITQYHKFHKVYNLSLKVSKFQNESLKSSYCPKYERKFLKNSALSIQGRIFQIFCSYFGQCDDIIFSFWNLLTFNPILYLFATIIQRDQFEFQMHFI